MKKKYLYILLIAFAAGLLFTGSCKHDPAEIQLPDPDPDPINDSIPCHPDTVYFKNTILPLLQSSCGIAGCHDPSSAQDGVILTDYDNIIETGDVDPFDPYGSDLYEVLVEDDPGKRMPPLPRNPLTNDQIESVYKWIMQGALNNYCDEADCDTLNVTFSGTVWPTIELNCFGCHSGASPSGGVSLEDHADMVAAVNSGRMMGTIRHEPGYSPMPQNGAKLSDCTISQIQKWINDGMPNN
jgi:mono/diheme cytochrome c family protein